MPQSQTFADVEASQIPAATATRPITRFQPMGSPTSTAASSEAAIGLTVMVLATRVGVVMRSASTQRKNAAAPPSTPKEITAIHWAVEKDCVAAKPPRTSATATSSKAPAPIEPVTNPSGEERAMNGRDQTL